ncbi:Uncharacterised protein [Vibrio cholerae]|uniref:Uncharacterized protein n=1 Tax=Vibrio cholerae TaxID=666 RepID=A0A655Q0Y8_VIBCL|nr:Uncharacterised protein [Vibrio cholerae]CSC89365.1 Uncharacterised protein [Vibrio cholerae]
MVNLSRPLAHGIGLFNHLLPNLIDPFNDVLQALYKAVKVVAQFMKFRNTEFFHARG